MGAAGPGSKARGGPVVVIVDVIVGEIGEIEPGDGGAVGAGSGVIGSDEGFGVVETVLVVLAVGGALRRFEVVAGTDYIDRGLELCKLH